MEKIKLQVNKSFVKTLVITFSSMIMLSMLFSIYVVNLQNTEDMSIAYVSIGMSCLACVIIAFFMIKKIALKEYTITADKIEIQNKNFIQEYLFENLSSMKINYKNDSISSVYMKFNNGEFTIGRQYGLVKHKEYFEKICKSVGGDVKSIDLDYGKNIFISYIMMLVLMSYFIGVGDVVKDGALVGVFLGYIALIKRFFSKQGYLKRNTEIILAVVYFGLMILIILLNQAQLILE